MFADTRAMVGRKVFFRYDDNKYAVGVVVEYQQGIYYKVLTAFNALNSQDFFLINVNPEDIDLVTSEYVCI